MKLFDKLFNREDNHGTDYDQFDTPEAVFEQLHQNIPSLSNDERMSLRNSEAIGTRKFDELDFDIKYDSHNDYEHDNAYDINEATYDRNREHMQAYTTTHREDGFNHQKTYPDTHGVYNTNGIIENKHMQEINAAIDRVTTLKTEDQFGEDFNARDIDDERPSAYNRNYLATINQVANHYEKVAKHQHDDEIDTEATDNEAIPTNGPIVVSTTLTQRDDSQHQYRNWDGSINKTQSYIRNEPLALEELKKEYADELPDVNPQIRIDNVRDGYGSMNATFIFDDKDQYDKWNQYANAGDDSFNTIRDPEKIDNSEFQRLNQEPELDLKMGLDDLNEHQNQQR